jgi:hypothetical protein
MNMEKLSKILILISVYGMIASIIGCVGSYCYSNASLLYWRCILDPSLEAEADYYMNLGYFFENLMLNVYLPIILPILIIVTGFFIYKPVKNAK